MRQALWIAATAAVALAIAPAAEARGSKSRSTGYRSSGSSAPAETRSDGGSCTKSSPCTGPRGGVYYHAPDGSKRYLPR